MIDNVYYIHGFLGRLGDHARLFNKSVVCGHSHKGGLILFKKDEKFLFELNCGYLGDAYSPALSYTPSKITGWNHGFGLVINGVPQFVHLK